MALVNFPLAIRFGSAGPLSFRVRIVPVFVVGAVKVAVRVGRRQS